MDLSIGKIDCTMSVLGPDQGNLLKGIVIWTVRREGIEPIKRVLAYLLFSVTLFFKKKEKKIQKKKFWMVNMANIVLYKLKSFKSSNIEKLLQKLVVKSCVTAFRAAAEQMSIPL